MQKYTDTFELWSVPPQAPRTTPPALHRGMLPGVAPVIKLSLRKSPYVQSFRVY